MRLLLAEDEKSLSKALVTILERNNYGVDAVYNGQEALDYLACGHYDGVILDIMMPVVDGITVLKTLRSQGQSGASAAAHCKVRGGRQGGGPGQRSPMTTSPNPFRSRNYWPASGP